MKPITIVIHGRDADAEAKVQEISALLHAALPHEQARKVMFVWDTADTPADELWQAAKGVYDSIAAYREDMVSRDMSFGTTQVEKDANRRQYESFMAKSADEIDNLISRLGVALSAGKAYFEPSDKQVLWAMNLAGVYMTSAGRTLEEMLPPAEYADFVRLIVTSAQNRTADTLYPDDSALMDAAKADGLQGAVYGDFVFEGKALSEAPPDLLTKALKMIPPGTILCGFGPSAYRGLQADYHDANGKTGSSYQYPPPADHEGASIA